MAKATQVEVPGETAEAVDTSTDQEASAAVDNTEVVIADTAPPAVPDPHVQANEEPIVVAAKPTGNPKADKPLDWSNLSGYQAMNAETPKDDPTANLPDMSTIDPAEIPYARQVLTKQGWIVSTAPDPNSLKYAGK